MQTVAITGASGFVGRALVDAAVRGGMRVLALGRAPDSRSFPSGVEVRRFDPNSSNEDGAAFDGADAVIHLAGETVAGRWTAEKKRAIAESRIAGTWNTIEAIARCSTRPAAFVCASASGYYGSRGDEPLVETSAPGDDFLAGVCVAWETEALRARTLGMRTVLMRTGIVLGESGALPQMRAPFAFGAGGPLGTGRQFMPWIHVEDLAALYCFALTNDVLSGPVNAVTADYATNARFAQAIGASLRRPSLMPAPALALRLVLGEFAESVLASQLLIPAAAEDAGFQWMHPNLERAVQSILAPNRAATLPRRFVASQTVRAPLESVFEFFAQPQNLESITPPSLRFAIERVSAPIRRATVIDYRLHLHGLPVAWKALISRWEPPYAFDDVQLHGPYASWHHQHRFRQVDSGVEIADTVDYVLPFMPFGNLASGAVRGEIERIFAYRKAAIAKHFT